jgi:hypothetical protein
MKKILMIFFALFLTSCTPRSVTEFMYLNSMESNVWEKEGVTELEKRKVLLECGLHPDAGQGWNRSLLIDKNDYVGPSKKGYVIPGDNRYIEAILCMQTSGFTSPINLYKLYCSRLSHDDIVGKVYLPTCKPGATPAVRSVERRFNSWYCLRYKQLGQYKPECEP